nr:MAG TPA: hypothetical protein [Bacteriophage sp.]
MSDYKRLTQWTENGASLDLGDPKSDMEARQALMVQFKKACNKLAELEDKLEEGTLVELPCKVGDIVYCLIAQGTHGTVYTTGAAISRAVTKIIWDGRRFEIYSERSHIWSNDYNECNYYGYLGETVFLTREAAEARLKELEGK